MYILLVIKVKWERREEGREGGRKGGREGGRYYLINNYYQL